MDKIDLLYYLQLYLSLLPTLKDYNTIKQIEYEFKK